MSVQENVWNEKHRPDSLDEVIGQEEQVNRLKEWVDDGRMPHLLLHGPAGTGKTASAVAFAKEKYGDDWRSNLIEMNASDERGIDIVRDRIKSVAQQSASGKHGFKIIYLDEADHLCLPGDAEVITGYPSGNNQEIKKIKNVSKDSEKIPSVDFETNEIQADEGYMVETGEAEFYDLTTSDGRTITASPKHPFFIVDENNKLERKELKELSVGDEIADYSEEIGVSSCEICGEYTTNKRFCSIDCKDEGHSNEMEGEDNPMHDEEWSDERREKIIEKLSDGRLSGENNPNYDGKFYGTTIWDMNDEVIEKFKQKMSKIREGTTLSEEHRNKIARGVKQSLWDEDVGEEYESRNYRYHLKDKDFVDCEICGDNLKVGGSDGIYVHHIDGNRENNSEDNLMDVCPTCHNFVCHDRWEDIVDGWKENDCRKEIKPDGGRKTPNTTQIETIQFSHEGKAYNITMEGTANFMLKNGILTHNTNDAQAALRRVMEDYSDQTRFILSCNYSSKLIDPIQSRCTPLPFRRLDDNEINQLITRILEREEIEYEESAVNKIIEYVEGDARRAVHTLQTSVSDGQLTEDIIQVVGGQVEDKVVEDIVSKSLNGEMEEAQEMVVTDVLPNVTDYSKFTGTLMRKIQNSDELPRDVKFYALSQLGELESNIMEGCNPNVQINSYLSKLPVARYSSIPNYQGE